MKCPLMASLFKLPRSIVYLTQRDAVVELNLCWRTHLLFLFVSAYSTAAGKVKNVCWHLHQLKYDCNSLLCP